MLAYCPHHPNWFGDGAVPRDVYVCTNAHPMTVCYLCYLDNFNNVWPRACILCIAMLIRSMAAMVVVAKIIEPQHSSGVRVQQKCIRSHAFDCFQMYLPAIECEHFVHKHKNAHTLTHTFEHSSQHAAHATHAARHRNVCATNKWNEVSCINFPISWNTFRQAVEQETSKRILLKAKNGM